MREHCKRAVATLTALMILFTMIPGFFVNSASSLSNEIQVYNYLVGKMGLNTAAACGLLANVKAESNFNPLGDGDAGTSYGLFQWHAGRKSRLIEYCETNGLDYHSIDGQMRYMEYELKKSYPAVYDYIKNVENTADGAYLAGYNWCYYYEIPANRELKADRRGETARSVYWKKYEIYKGRTVEEEYAMEPSDYRVPFSRAIKIEDNYVIGSDVLYMQLCLYCLGYNIEADGCYGPATASAVKRFQTSQGLTADGVCGSQTWNAIENALFGGSLRITRQPQAAVADLGGELAFSVRAAGSSPAYQWHYRKSGDADWTLWTGKTSASVRVTADETWDGAQVRCVVTDSGGTTLVSNAATASVIIPLAITRQPQSVTAVEGETVTFEVAAMGNGLSYQWYYRKAGSSDWTLWQGHTQPSTSAVANGSWNGMQVKCTVSDSRGGSVDSQPAAVTLSLPFEITGQPQSLTAEAGETAEFTVKATGRGLSYQWYMKKPGDAGWTKWSGYTSPTLSVKAHESWDGMQVMCIVADSAGNTLQSASATLSVTLSVVITRQPQSVTAQVGDKVVFSVGATGKDLSYQWYIRKTGETWKEWTGKTTAEITGTADGSWDGMQVMCMASDSAGNMANTVTVTVKIAVPLDITQHPQSLTASPGDTVSFSVKASGTGLSYQWYYKKPGDAGWTKWAGRTAAAVSETADAGWKGMQVRCVVTDSSGSTAESETAYVTLVIPIVITQQPQSVTAKPGDPVQFTVTATGENLSYQWYMKKPGDAGWTRWAGYTSPTLSVKAYENWNGMQVRCELTDGSGGRLTSGYAALSVVNPIVITQQPQSVRAKAGDTAQFTVKATGESLGYQWYMRKPGDAGWTKWSGYTSSTLSVKAHESWDGMQVMCSVTDGSGNRLNSGYAVLSVYVPIVITQQPQSVTASPGDTVQFTVTATGESLGYQWFLRKPGDSGWTKWSGHTSPTLSVKTYGSWDGMTVRCRVSDGSGNILESSPADITLHAPLEITRHPASVTAGIGENVKFSVAAKGLGLSYQWYYRKVGNSWKKWDGHTEATTYALSNESWDGMQVRCIVSDKDGDMAYSASADVKIVVPLAITQQPQPVRVRVGDTMQFSVKANGVGLRYQWYYKKPSDSEWTLWSGQTADTASSAAAESWNGMRVRCAVSDSRGSRINSTAVTVTFDVPFAVTQQPQSANGQVGDTVKFTVGATGAGLSYQWYYRKSSASDWTIWSGQTTATASVKLTEGWNGMRVRCSVTDGRGSRINSSVASVTVVVPFAVTQQPQSAKGQVGDTVKFTVKATGSGLSYQWYYRKSSASDWTIWSGQTTATASVKLTEGWNGMLVRCAVTDGRGSRINSSAASVTVVAPFAVTQQPQSVSAKVGDTVKFTVKATGTGLNYQWYYRKSSASDWTIWSGQTAATASVKLTEGWNGMLVRCAVTDGRGSRINSSVAAVTVVVPFAVTQQPQSAKGQVGDTVKFTVKATGTGLSYQWYYRKSSASDWTIWSGQTTATASVKLTEGWNGMRVRCSVTDSRGSRINSSAAAVTVVAPLAVTQQPQSVSAKVGDTVKFTVKATGTGLSYQWYYKKSGATEWSFWSGHNAATTSAVANASWNGMKVRCAVTDSRGSRINSTAAVVKIVLPLAVTQQPKSVTAKIGDTVKFTVKATGTGLSYQWYYRKVGALNWSLWEGHTSAETSAVSNESWNGMGVMCVVTDSSGNRVNSDAVTVTLAVD